MLLGRMPFEHAKFLRGASLTHFVVNFRESNLHTFGRQIHQFAKIGGRGIQANFGNAKILRAPVIKIGP